MVSALRSDNLRLFRLAALQFAHIPNVLGERMSHCSSSSFSKMQMKTNDNASKHETATRIRLSPRLFRSRCLLRKIVDLGNKIAKTICLLGSEKRTRREGIKFYELP